MKTLIWTTISHLCSSPCPSSVIQALPCKTSQGWFNCSECDVSSWTVHETFVSQLGHIFQNYVGGWERRKKKWNLLPKKWLFLAESALDTTVRCCKVVIILNLNWLALFVWQFSSCAHPPDILLTWEEEIGKETWMRQINCLRLNKLNTWCLTKFKVKSLRILCVSTPLEIGGVQSAESQRTVFLVTLNLCGNHAAILYCVYDLKNLIRFRGQQFTSRCTL